MNQRVQFVKWFFLCFALIIVGRAVQLQLWTDPRIARLAQRQFTSKLSILPRRGLILDRNGEGLAMSLQVQSLFFRPELLRKELNRTERKRVLGELQKILKLPSNAILQKFNSAKGFVWVKRQLSEKEAKEVREKGMLEYGDGIGMAQETKRFYPNDELAAHALGSVNVDGQGLEGLELYYDSLLSGERIRIASQKDAKGRRLFRDDKGLVALKDGQSLVLTLDKTIQYEAEKALQFALQEYQAQAGTILIASVETGEILALANAPTFNPNESRNASLAARRNRAITDTYEPGSTFKPFIVAHALQRGKTVKSKVYCERGQMVIGDRKISEAEAHEKFEWLTLGEILKFSSNIGAAKLSLEMGPAVLGNFMEKLGIGRKTNIDLPGEVGGLFDRKGLKVPIRMANTGFGHGFTVTPLQMLTYYLSLANGGTWVQPRIVKAVLNESPSSLEKGEIRWRLGYRFDKGERRPLFDPKITQEVAAMLKEVTTEKGTGMQAQIEEWPVAGKTGTAQKIDPQTKKYSRSKYIASFAGFAPADKPQLVAIVIIDEPKKAYYAGSTAAPVFRQVMRASLIRERVQPRADATRRLQLTNRNSVQEIQKSLNVKDAKTLSGIEKEKVRVEGNQVFLPSLKGMSVREVFEVLENIPLDVEVHGSGVLVEQHPSYDAALEKGSKLKLIFKNEVSI